MKSEDRSNYIKLHKIIRTFNEIVIIRIGGRYYNIILLFFWVPRRVVLSTFACMY